jgi:hypothetical protein
MSQRRRDPPPAGAWCFSCGWTGVPDHLPLRDDHGDVVMTVSLKPCPRCGRETTQLEREKRPLPVQIVEAVRQADLTAQQLLELADAVDNAPRGISPRQLADQVPGASTIITVASRAGEASWIALLGLILTVMTGYLAIDRAHTDAQQAHRDAERAVQQAHEDAERALRDGRDQADAAVRNTGKLSDEDVRRIADAVDAQLRRRAEP